MRNKYQGKEPESNRKFEVVGGEELMVRVPLPMAEVWAEMQAQVEELTGKPNLPRWFIDDKFDIQVQVRDNPTNDQLRLVMQSVLAERFKLAAHYESPQLPVFALVLANPGETGTQLRPHTDDPPCASVRPPAGSWLRPQEMVAGGFPADCGRIEALPSSPGRIHVGARAIPIELLAATLPQMHNLDRAVLDQTGLAGTYDFAFEWSVRQVSRANPHGEEPSPEFLRDLNEQLGLKLEPHTGPVELVVIDHVEKPETALP
jgi:uncharacterized protein (TIGR03435 family)